MDYWNWYQERLYYYRIWLELIWSTDDRQSDDD